MGQVIHAKATESGHVFRMWSTNSDTYVTPEMSKEQLVRYLVEDEIERALCSLGMEIESRIERAMQTGDSCHGGGRGLGRWEDVREVEAPMGDDAEGYIAGKIDVTLTTEWWRKSVPPIDFDGKVLRVQATISLDKAPPESPPADGGAFAGACISESFHD